MLSLSIKNKLVCTSKLTEGCLKILRRDRVCCKEKISPPILVQRRSRGGPFATGTPSPRIILHGWRAATAES